jgi:hypothetical protein
MILSQSLFVKKCKYNPVVIFFLFLFLTSCKPPVLVDDLACEAPSINQPVEKSKNLTVDIHVDGTPSMQGYVSNSTESLYSQTLKVLDETARLNAKEVKYYRLGTTSNPISRDKYRQAAEAKFYSGNDGGFPLLSVSQIETAINPPKNEILSVIVTDLYQKNTDITTITERIKQYYLNNKNDPNYAIGIIGIKSEFNGEIFLEDNRNSSINYQTTSNKLKQYHPFYLIFLGHYSDIAHYFDLLASNSNTKVAIEQGGAVIFSPDYLLQNTVTLAEYPDLPLEEDISRPVSLNDGQVAIEKDDLPIEMLEIDKREADNLKLKYDVSLKYLKHGLKIDPQKIMTNFKLQKFDGFDQSFKDANQTSSLGENLTAKEWSISDPNDYLSFNFSINPGEIDPGVYLFNIDTIAGGLQSQSWWQEWDGSSQDILNGEGWKTYNLARFLEQMKTITTEAMLSRNDPKFIGRFCYAIQRN